MRDRHRLTSFRCLSALFLTAVFLIAVYRAATQSITYDEALTHLMFKKHFFSQFLSPDVATVNVHFLYVVLARLGAWLFGLSDFVLRLPALCGTALYLWGALALARRLLRAPLQRALLLGLLTLNPFVMDFMPFARGYSLALGALLLALARAISVLQRLNRTGRLDLRGAETVFLWLALAVAANLSFVFPVLAAAGAFFTLLLVIVLQGRARLPWRQWLHGLECAVFLGEIIILFTLLAPPAKLLHVEQLNGRPAFLETAYGLASFSLNHARADYRNPPLSPMFRVGVRNSLLIFITGMALATAAQLCGVILNQAFPLVLTRKFVVPPSGGLAGPPEGGTTNFRPRLRLSELARLVPLLAFLLSLAGYLTGHALFNIYYPWSRTGLFLVPLFTLSLGALLGWLQRRSGSTVIRGFSVLLMFAFLAVFLAQFSSRYHILYPADADTKKTLALLKEIHAQNPNHKIRLCADWLLTPPLEFYKDAQELDWLEVAALWAYHEAVPYDAYFSRDVAMPLRFHAVPLLRNETSGTILSLNVKHLRGAIHTP